MQSLRRQWCPVLLWALAALGIVMVSQAFSQAAEPTLAIPSPAHDAGVVWEGETISHTFEVRNEGAGELRILEVRPG